MILFLINATGINATQRTNTPIIASFQELYNITAISPAAPKKLVVKTFIFSTNKKHEKSLAKISQTYLLENGANYNKISKKKIDNNYIITVPIEDD